MTPRSLALRAARRSLRNAARYRLGVLQAPAGLRADRMYWACMRNAAYYRQQAGKLG